MAPPPLLYVIELDKMRTSGNLVVSLRTRSVKKDGQWTKDKPAAVAYRSLELVADPSPRLAAVSAASDISHATSYSSYGYGYGSGERRFATGRPSARAG